MSFTETLPLVSVVLRTKNEARRIERCLRSLKHQTYSLLEIIVVDNNSTDATKEIAKDFAQVVLNSGPERAHQGNIGMLDAASGSYVMYLDADMILEPGIVNAAVKRMESQVNQVGFYVNEVVLGKGIWFQARRFERQSYRGTCIDAARFIRRSAVVKVGGFDTDSFATPSAEDWDLDRRLRDIGEISMLDYSPENPSRWDRGLYDYVSNNLDQKPELCHGLFHDEIDLTPIVYAKKKLYYFPTLSNYSEKWGERDPIVRRQLGPAYRLGRVFFENAKWKTSLRHPLLLLIVLSSRISIGLLYTLRQGLQPKLGKR